MKKLFLFIAAALVSTGMWAAASTTTDGKYATGTVDFSEIGTLTATTTYWHNGVKFYSGNSAKISANNTSWSADVNIPAYCSNITAGKEADKGKWGSAGTGKQYTMSGFACSQHTIGIHVNQACTLTVVVNKNVGSDTDDAGITASIDDVAYGTAYTSSNYKTAGSTALTVSSARADKTNAPGRYTLTIVVADGNLTDGEAVVKMFNGSSGSGAGKLFCWESITVTAAPKYTVTYKANNGSEVADVVDNQATTVADCSFTYTGYDFTGWNTAADGKGTAYAVGAAVSSNLTLHAQWTAHVASDDATLSALSVDGCTLSPAFASATTAYTITLPLGSSMPAVGDVTATKNDSHAEDPVVSITDNVITIACEAEDDTKLNYTITVTYADTKDITLIWKPNTSKCGGGTVGSSTIKSDNASVSSYINKITFTGGGGAENAGSSGSLNVGNNAGNMFTLSAQTGYAFESLNFHGKIQDANCEYSIDGGTSWTTLTSTNTSGDDCYEIFSSAEVTEFRLRSTGTEGVWIRNMQLTIKAIPYAITKAATENGSVTVKVAGAVATTATIGQTVNLIASPADGYVLASYDVYKTGDQTTTVTVTDGAFTMPAYPVTVSATFSVSTALDENEAEVKAVKVIRNGQIFIERDGKTYNVLGNCIK